MNSGPKLDTFLKEANGTLPRIISCKFYLLIVNVSNKNNLRGTQEYGDFDNDNNPWSIFWNIQEVDEFLFSSVDKKYWLIVSKKDLLGEDGFKVYGRDWVNVIASSSNCESHRGNDILYFYSRTTLT